MERIAASTLAGALALPPGSSIPLVVYFVASAGAACSSGPFRRARVTAHDASALAVCVTLWWDATVWVLPTSAPRTTRVGFPSPWQRGDVVMVTDLVVARAFGGGSPSLATTRESASAVLSRGGVEAPGWAAAAAGTAPIPGLSLALMRGLRALAARGDEPVSLAARSGAAHFSHAAEEPPPQQQQRQEAPLGSLPRQLHVTSSVQLVSLSPGCRVHLVCSVATFSVSGGGGGGGHNAPLRWLLRPRDDVMGPLGGGAGHHDAAAAPFVELRFPRNASNLGGATAQERLLQALASATAAASSVARSVGGAVGGSSFVLLTNCTLTATGSGGVIGIGGAEGRRGAAVEDEAASLHPVLTPTPTTACETYQCLEAVTAAAAAVAAVAAEWEVEEACVGSGEGTAAAGVVTLGADSASLPEEEGGGVGMVTPLSSQLLQQLMRLPPPPPPPPLLHHHLHHLHHKSPSLRVSARCAGILFVTDNSSFRRSGGECALSGAGAGAVGGAAAHSHAASSLGGAGASMPSPPLLPQKFFVGDVGYVTRAGGTLLARLTPPAMRALLRLQCSACGSDMEVGEDWGGSGGGDAIARCGGGCVRRESHGTALGAFPSETTQRLGGAVGRADAPSSPQWVWCEAWARLVEGGGEEEGGDAAGGREDDCSDRGMAHAMRVGGESSRKRHRREGGVEGEEDVSMAASPTPSAMWVRLSQEALTALLSPLGAPEEFAEALLARRSGVSGGEVRGGGGEEEGTILSPPPLPPPRVTTPPAARSSRVGGGGRGGLVRFDTIHVLAASVASPVGGEEAQRVPREHVMVRLLEALTERGAGPLVVWGLSRVV